MDRILGGPLERGGRVPSTNMADGRDYHLIAD